MDDLEKLALFGNVPGWVAEHWSDAPGSRRGMPLAAVVYKAVHAVIGDFVAENEKARLNQNLSETGKLSAVAEAGKMALAELQKKWQAVGNLKRERDKILDEFKPTLPYEGAELALREAEVRRLLPIASHLELFDIYLDAIQEGNQLLIAAIENVPRVPIVDEESNVERRGAGNVLAGLSAQQLAEGRKRRIAIEDPAAGARLQQLETAIADVTSALHAAKGYVEEEARVQPDKVVQLLEELDETAA